MAEAPARGGPTQITTTTTTIVTAGGSSTWKLVRSILVANVTAGAVTVTVGVGTSNADTTAKRILSNVSIAAGDSLLWEGFLPLLGGGSPDLLYALSDTTNGAAITVGLVTGP